MEHLTQYAYLQKQIISGTISHAYLFVGPQNTGKLATAEKFAADLFCECGKCEICRQIRKKIFPEILFVAPAKEQILIEQVREIRRFLTKQTIGGSWRVVIVSKAHLLTKQAANALLKTLEEPGKKQVIMLTADRLNNLPETVVSRCQIIKFLPMAFSLDKNNKDFRQWTDFFESSEKTNKIAVLEKFLNKKNQSQMNKIVDLWIIVWREILLTGSARYPRQKAGQILQKLLEIKKKGNNINIKLQLENIIINL